MITAELAQQIWEYDSETGVMAWKIKPCQGVSVGQIAGWANSRGYLQVMYKGKRYTVHRLAWLITTGEWPVNEIDHINGVTDDNRILNLRDVPRSQNHQNRPCHRAGQLRFTTFNKASGKWRAQAPGIKGKQKYLGYYSTMEEANAVAEQWIKDSSLKENE
jgi:hypothetical protein